jgi:predicted nucleic acid-binding protein
MNAIDTNIWIYAHDRRDPAKQQKAQDLINTLHPQALLWQVGCEFLAAAHKLAPYGFTEDQTYNSLDRMLRMSTKLILPDPESWIRCRSLQKDHSLNFWDAILIASCLLGNVSRLYSEDLSDQQDINGLKIINPFRR